MTEEQKARRRENMAKARAARRAKRDAAASLAADAAEQHIASEGAADETALSRPIAEIEAATARRERLARRIPAEDLALFSDAELAQIEAQEEEASRERKKRQARSTIQAELKLAADVANDLVPADRLRSEDERRRLNREVQIYFELPEDGSGDPAKGRIGYYVDGRCYDSGRWHTVPVHVAESLQSNHYRTWLGEMQFSLLDQQKPGRSAVARLGRLIPSFEIRDAA